MCIVIAKNGPAKTPSEEVIRRCWTSNPHGAGFAFVNTDGGVTIRKGFMTLDALLEGLRPLMAVESAAYLIHFRIATHGTRDEVNTHPFFAVEDKVAIAHNGVLPYGRLVHSSEGRSDTNAFTEDILKNLPEGWYTKNHWCHLIEEYMGSGNKIAVLDKDGIRLLNRNNWVEDTETGLFYSNAGFRGYSRYDHKPTRTWDYDDESSYSYSYNRGVRTPTTTQSTTAPTFQSGSDFTKSKTSADYSHFTVNQKTAFHRVCSRMHFIKRRGCLTESEITGIKDDMKAGFLDPEHVECGIDMLWEAIVEVPSTTLNDIQILVGATSLHDLFKKCHSMQVEQDRHTETVKIEAPTQTVIDVSKQAEPPLWNNVKAAKFKGKPVRVTLDPLKSTGTNTARLIEVTGVSPATLDYKRIGVAATGCINWSIIKDIEELHVLPFPMTSELLPYVGRGVVVEPREGSNLMGTLQAVDLVNLTVSIRLLSGAVATEPVSKILRVISLDKKTVTEETQSAASSK